jgi:hypothetical protein
VSIKSDELLNVFTLERAHNNAPCTVIAFCSYECSTDSVVELHNTRETAGRHLFRHSQYILCSRRVIGIYLMTDSSVLASLITFSLFLHHTPPHRITSQPIPSLHSHSLSYLTLRSHHSSVLTCIRHPDKAYISY